MKKKKKKKEKKSDLGIKVENGRKLMCGVTSGR
jgi:hypothetical protein